MNYIEQARNELKLLTDELKDFDMNSLAPYERNSLIIYFSSDPQTILSNIINSRKNVTKYKKKQQDQMEMKECIIDLKMQILNHKFSQIDKKDITFEDSSNLLVQNFFEENQDDILRDIDRVLQYMSTRWPYLDKF